MTTTTAVRKIPLNKLVPSPTNVRKVPPTAAANAELKASIRVRGLLQNLVAHPAVGDEGKALGLLSEIIAWRLRLFVPTAEDRGPAILGAILDCHPLLDVRARAAA